MTEDQRKSRVSIMDTKAERRSQMLSQSQQGTAMTPAQLAAIAAAKTGPRLKNRRASFGFSSVPGIRPLERTSQVGFEFRRPALLYMPTYQIDPKIKFNNFIVSQIIEQNLDEQFTGHKYHAQNSPALALKMAGDLMRATKSLFNRYRIIAIVTVGQKRAQSYNNAVSFLWDYERDSYVDMHRETNTAFMQVTVFGIYLD